MSITSSQFDVREATVASVHHALFSKSHSCRDIVSAFIARIERFNPIINAIITLNSAALDEADQVDHILTSGEVTGVLIGIPILLKDNFDIKGLPSTAGSQALADLMPLEDCPTVKAFRKAGAIILGKTNMHEFALEGLSISSLAGQTLNPYDLTRTPGGSSGGTGAAIAASFAVFGTGTDTVNSLRNPASANNLYSLRPTRGLICRTGVLPVSYTQDTVGVIGRCLDDVAIGITVMADVGPVSSDSATTKIPDAIIGTNYVVAMEDQNRDLQNLRVGVLHSLFEYSDNHEAREVNSVILGNIKALEAAGATIVNVGGPKSEVQNDITVYNADYLLANLDAQKYEFKYELNSYLSSNSDPRTMESIFENSKDWMIIPRHYDYLRTALSSKVKPIPLEQLPTSPKGKDEIENEYLTRLKRIIDLKSQTTCLFEQNHLDILVYPQQRRFVVSVGSPSQAHRNGILAALTGFPSLCMPAGFGLDSKGTEIPIGMELMGMPWTEKQLISIGKQVQNVLVQAQTQNQRSDNDGLWNSHLPLRRVPKEAGLDQVVPIPENGYSAVPMITPKGMNDHEKQLYPLGTLDIQVS